MYCFTFTELMVYYSVMKITRHRAVFFYTGLLLSFFLEISAQENTLSSKITGGLSTYRNSNAPEKIYVQTDKDFYGNGETIWYKAYLLNGIGHTASTKSKVVYVELVDSKDNIITQQKLFVESSGAAGDIAIPKEIEEGIYVLRAYTKYMLNDKEPILFQKEIRISSLLRNLNDEHDKRSKKKASRSSARKPETDTLARTKPIVQFFPEGGELISGIESVLGVKVTDTQGNGFALKGKILDQNGRLASLFDSYEFGLGWSSFKPEPNTDYYLHVPIDGTMVKYLVPSPVEKGYALRAMNRGEHVMITASTNIAKGLQGAFLIGHVRGNIIFKQELQPNVENSTTIKLLTAKLPDGIAHFTLFAPNSEPVCERLTFIENPKNNLNLSMKTDRSDYGLREKVNLDLTVVDAKAKPLKGEFSMSIFTKNEMQEDADNIKSWLLLNSDLGETIANPNYFFQEDVNGRAYMLNLLMLTHGWRRFTWKSILNDSVRKEMAFPPEKGIMITGTTKALNNKYQPKEALATLNIVDNELIQEKKGTDTLGRFSFGPFIFEDSITAVVNANSWHLSKKRKDRLSIYLDPHFPEVKVKNNREIDRGSTKKIINAVTKPYPSVVQQKTMPDFEYDPKLIKLNEVVVKDKKISKQALLDERLNARTIYGYPSTRLIPDSIPGLGRDVVNAFNALRYVAGVQVRGTFPNQQAFIRPIFGESGTPPLYLLDGVPVSLGQIQSIQVTDILFIDVLKGADASIYGGRAAGGVVAVYMKTGEFTAKKPKENSNYINATIPGFYKTREFYKPNYAIAKPAHQRPDYRRTLHWEPDIKIETGSTSKLNFYTGDATGNYVIRIEGVTNDGRLLHAKYDFNVLDAD